MIFYRVTDNFMPEIRPAPHSRDWMDKTTQGFANRCLPLRIACGLGWEVLNALEFKAMWTGFNRREGVVMDRDDIKHWAAPHFGYGTLTFNMHFLLRTDEALATYVRGPANQPRDAIQPLDGVVETGWAPMTFTMNWKFTRPGEWVHFKVGEPICQLFPVCLADANDATPVIRPVDDDLELAAAYREWSESRAAFHAAMHDGDEAAVRKGWQGDYMRGADLTRLSLKRPSPVDCQP